jgi:hypothetical protein
MMDGNKLLNLLGRSKFYHENKKNINTYCKDVFGK